MSALLTIVLLSALFVAATASTQLASEQQIDMLLDELLAKYERNHRAAARSLQRVAQIPGHDGLAGVAHLGNKIYVVEFGSNKIQVYDDASHSKVNDITVEGLQYAADIAACEKNNKLYVLDQHPSNTVWKVDPASGQFSAFINLGSGDQAMTISARDGRVLLTAKFVPKLFVYNGEDGSSISTVNLPTKLKPQHAVETASGTYFVSHYGSVGRRDSDGVSEFDGSGTSLRMYGGQRGSADNQLQKPGHLALKPDGSVIVIDFENRRVVEIDSSLKSATILLTRDDFAGSRQAGDDGDLNARPWRSDVGAQGDKLIIGTSKGVVIVYDHL